MSLRIRLQRRGKKKQPFYRVVVTSRERGTNADYIESLGFYNPQAEGEDEEVRLDEDRALHWLRTGAEPSDSVHDLLSDEGILETLEERSAG